MNIEISSVSRKRQKLSKAPAAVYVLTNEDIRRSGVTSIPEALRMVPGLQVARIDAGKWAISSRGLNRRFANKILVLIDGRSVYTNFFSGTFWDHHDVLLEDIERIEVIRGPGATMWGANAVNGVINIITKSARDTQGLLVTAGGGNLENANGAVRYGGKHGENLFYRGFAKDFIRGPLSRIEGGPASDRWRSLRGGGRLDWQISETDLFTLHGDLSRGRANQTAEPSPFSPVGGLPDTAASDRTTTGSLMGRWQHSRSESSSMALQCYYSEELRSEYGIDSSMRHLDFEFQHRFQAASRHDLVWGLGYRASWSRVPSGIFIVDPEARHDNLFGTFLQDDISLVADKLTLSIGSKFQHNSYSGFEVQPGVRLLWSLSARQGIWGAASRAVRTPARLELDLGADYAVRSEGPLGLIGRLRGNPDFRSEVLHAYEIGYRRQFGRRVTVDVATFLNHYDGLATHHIGVPSLDLGPPPVVIVPVEPRNGLASRAVGVEVATSTNLSDDWQLFANYTWLSPAVSRDAEPSVPGMADPVRDPSHQVQFRSNLDLTKKLSLDTSVYFVSHLPVGVPSYVRLDNRIGYRVNRLLDLSLVMQNLLDSHHLEFIPEDYSRSYEPRRAVFVKMSWTL